VAEASGVLSAGGGEMIAPHPQCCCPECVAARRAFVLRTHPIHARRDEDVAPTLIPVDQALAMELEIIEDLEGRLAIAHQNVRALRDCA
jgi:hypothetical protein